MHASPAQGGTQRQAPRGRPVRRDLLFAESFLWSLPMVRALPSAVRPCPGDIMFCRESAASPSVLRAVPALAVFAEWPRHFALGEA